MVIVTSYLITNTLQLAVTILEFAAIDMLFGWLPQYLSMYDVLLIAGTFCYYYLLSSDIISILTMLTCNSRLFIYLKFNEELRHVIMEGCRCLASHCLPHPINRHSKVEHQQPPLKSSMEMSCLTENHVDNGKQQLTGEHDVHTNGYRLNKSDTKAETDNNSSQTIELISRQRTDSDVVL